MDEGYAEPEGPREVKVEPDRAGGAKGVLGRRLSPLSLIVLGDEAHGEGEAEREPGSLGADEPEPRLVGERRCDAVEYTLLAPL